MQDEEYPETTRDLIERVRAGRLTRAEWRSDRADREALAEIVPKDRRYSHAEQVAAILRRERGVS